MSHWNYRIVSKAYPPGIDGETLVGYHIHEAYYDESGKVWAISNEGIDAHGESVEQLRDDFENMRKAFDAPVLEYDKVPEEGAVHPLDQKEPTR